MSRKGNPLDRSQLERQWERLSNRYLPLTFKDLIWRYSRSLTKDDPEQGWKLHISATILTANQILTTVGPLLRRRNVLFKAPATLLELMKINSGLYSEFSQVGKFMTVYPSSSEDAVLLAAKLDRIVPPHSGPTIPFDIQLRPGSAIYYRYGGFKPLNIKHRRGTHSPAIRNPKGKLIPDLRRPGSAVPKWMDDPFIALNNGKKNPAPDLTPLRTSILTYEALSQRGKGGVYRALDISVSPFRLCVLKEGRKNGETEWDGRDGYWRVKNEDRVLCALSASSVVVPKVFSRFKVEHHYYLVMEYIAGPSLHTVLSRKRKPGIAKTIDLSLKLAKLLAEIHGAGWVWRDCKPINIIVSKTGDLVPIDFEGACRVSRPDRMPWGTPGYVPRDSLERTVAVNRVSDDLYALGVVLYQLFTGRGPTTTPLKLPVRKLRKGIPAEVSSVISALLNPDRDLRPSASSVSRALEAISGCNGPPAKELPTTLQKKK